MKLAYGLLLGVSPLYAFQERPWFAEPIEMHAEASYTYAFFPKVNHAEVQLKSNFQENVLGFEFYVSPTSEWQVDLQIESAATTYSDIYFRAGGGSLRYSWFDDIGGDPISIITGISAMGATETALHDISSPYANTLNLEMNMSLGKEWSHNTTWTTRIWGFGSLGISNQGNLWNRFRLSYERNFGTQHLLFASALGYFGYGPVEKVHTEDFHGWGKLQHRSIDIGVGYRYRFKIWGYLELSYFRRVYAFSYPQDQNTFVLSYNLPFSAL